VRRPVAVALITSLLLGIAMFCHEFAIGLEHYSPMTEGSKVAYVDIEKSRLSLRAAPTLDQPPIVMKISPGTLELHFDTLKPGAIGKLLGLEHSIKLQRIDLKPTGQSPTKIPLNGGRDLCHEFLALMGFAGRPIATSDTVSATVSHSSDAVSVAISYSSAAGAEGAILTFSPKQQSHL